MGLLENGLKLGTGAAIGIGAIILVPVILPVVSAVAKPVINAGINGGMMFYQKARIVLAEASEMIGDVVAEAKAKLKTEQNPIASAAFSEGELDQ